MIGVLLTLIIYVLVFRSIVLIVFVPGILRLRCCIFRTKKRRSARREHELNRNYHVFISN